MLWIIPGEGASLLPEGHLEIQPDAVQCNCEYLHTAGDSRAVHITCELHTAGVPVPVEPRYTHYLPQGFKACSHHLRMTYHEGLRPVHTTYVLLTMRV